MLKARKHEGWGVLTLARPESLNALTTSMVVEAANALRSWENDPEVFAIWLEGEGKKAFCAGGDVRALVDKAQGGGPQAQEDFFRQEYALDLRIHQSRKPVIALGHGYVIGGGLGLFQASKIRLVSPSTKATMPEIRIGFFTDVGASYFFGRLPEPIGLFLATTGQEMDAVDLLYLGLADRGISEEAVNHLKGSPPKVAWEKTEDENENAIGLALDLFPPPDEIRHHTSSLSLRLTWLQKEFPRSPSLKDLLSFFEFNRDHTDPWIARAMQAGLEASPHSLECILELFSRTRGASLERCFEIEREIARKAATHPDFSEGVRARLIDKDQRPRWKKPRRTS